jgi:hypothetical protein
VDAIAAKAATDTLWLAVTNLDPTRRIAIAARLAGISAKTAVGETLTAADGVNTFDAPNTVAPKPVSAKFPGDQPTVQPKSVTPGRSALRPVQRHHPSRISRQLRSAVTHCLCTLLVADMAAWFIHQNGRADWRTKTTTSRPHTKSRRGPMSDDSVDLRLVENRTTAARVMLPSNNITQWCVVMVCARERSHRVVRLQRVQAGRAGSKPP